MVYQALFGDKDGAYVLLKTNHPDRSLIERICNSTDLSSKPGPGIEWSSGVRGFPFRDHYVILKTYLDDSPNVRFGRVFTHAFISSKKDLFEIELDELFRIFSEKMNKEISIDNEFIPFSGLKNANTKVDQRRLAKVWSGFIKGRTVVWLSQDFDSCVSFLWKKMPKAFRPDFEFDISFNSTQVSLKGKISIINSPESLRSKWADENKFEVIGEHEANFQPNEIELFLLGAKESEDFSKFIRDHNFQINSFEDLRIIQAIFSAFTNINSIDFLKANTALRLTLKNIDQNHSGKALAELFFVRMVELLAKAQPDMILALRKQEMPTSVLDSSVRMLRSLQTWCEVNLFKFDIESQRKILLIPSHLKEEGIEEWWRSGIHSFIKSEFHQWTEEKSRVLSMWLCSQKGIGILIALENSMIEFKGDFENQTAKIISDFLSENNTDLLSEFAKRGFYLLHASVLLKCVPDDVSKIRKQIEVDQQKGSESLIFMRSELGLERFVLAALKQPWDTRIIQLLSSSIIEEPYLIKLIHLENEIDQEVIHHILSHSEINAFYKDPRKELVFPLLDILVKGKLSSAGKNILKFFKNYHLLDYQNRTRVWSLIHEVGASYLKNTAKAFLENLERTSSDIPEELLRKEILSQEMIGWFLNKYNRSMADALRFFEFFGEIPERALRDYLYYFDSPINSVESKRLGDLVTKENWKECAGIIYSKCDRFPSFRIALNACYSELSLLDKLAAAYHGYANNGNINEDDFWNSLLQVACALYPEGPKQNKIWKEAGGDNSDLIYYGSGKDMWRSALSGVKKGAYKKISGKSILNKMLSSHPRNSDLKFLLKVYKGL